MKCNNIHEVHVEKKIAMYMRSSRDEYENVQNISSDKWDTTKILSRIKLFLKGSN